MNHSSPPASRHADWDLILVMVCFIAACLTVSLVLPHWHAASQPVATVTASTPRPAPINLAATPAQKNAALAAYREGMEQLRGRQYQAASAAFKKALEKFPSFAEAYIGLGEANQMLGVHQAAVLNAQHGLDQVMADHAVLLSGLSLAAAQVWAHRILGTALLSQAEGELGRDEDLLGRMDATRASFHCQHVLSLDQADASAQACAKTAAALARRP